MENRPFGTIFVVYGHVWVWEPSDRPLRPHWYSTQGNLVRIFEPDDDNVPDWIVDDVTAQQEKRMFRVRDLDQAFVTGEYAMSRARHDHGLTWSWVRTTPELQGHWEHSTGIRVFPPFGREQGWSATGARFDDVLRNMTESDAFKRAYGRVPTDRIVVSGTTKH